MKIPPHIWPFLICLWCLSCIGGEDDDTIVSPPEANFIFINGRELNLLNTEIASLDSSILGLDTTVVNLTMEISLQQDTLDSINMVFSRQYADG